VAVEAHHLIQLVLVEPQLRAVLLDQVQLLQITERQIQVGAAAEYLLLLVVVEQVELVVLALLLFATLDHNKELVAQ